MKKTRKILIYVSSIIISFLIIPEIILRSLTSEQLARVSDYKSLVGIVNPLLSLLAVLGLLSIVLAVITVSVLSNVFRSKRESK